MSRPHDLPDDTGWLDLDKSSRLMTAYKTGKLGRAIFRYRMIVECGVPEHLIPRIIADVDAAPPHMVEREAMRREMLKASGQPRQFILRK